MFQSCELRSYKLDKMKYIILKSDFQYDIQKERNLLENKQ